MTLDLQQHLDRLDIPADWVGLRYVSETTTTRAIRDGNPQSNRRRRDRGVMVEVLVQGQFGYAATNHLTTESIQAAAQKAYQQAIAAAQWSLHPFTSAVRPPSTGRYQSQHSSPLDTIPVRDLIELLQQVCDHLKVSDKIVKTASVAQLLDIEHHYISSNGADIQQTFGIVNTHLTATAQDGTITQQRSDNGSFSHCYQSVEDLVASEAMLLRAERIGAQAVELLEAEDCPDTQTTLVLAPDQMMLQIHESIGHPLELDRILGDERNYAGSSFVKLSDFGRLQYGSPLMNVTFDPTVTGELASYGFDDVGAPAEREYLIEGGVLKRGLGSLESQQRSQIPGVANSRACSWNRPPIDRMANLNLEPGDTSFADMIAAIEHGVYMESNRSWSIDDYRNKFQFGCEYAKLIENGKLTQTLRNPNYRGISNPFWRSLSQVGDRSTFELYGTPYCGKGEPNQCVRVGHASPVCAFENIEVFGGAA